MTLNAPIDDRAFMEAALHEAAQAAALGEVPIGALIVRQGMVLAQAHNYRESWQDPTAHAEMIAIRTAAKQSGSWRLLDTTLYVTLEPCAMCMGAIILARISRVVFGAWDPKAGACGSVIDLSRHSRLNHHVAVSGGMLQEDSRQLLQSFFRTLRVDAAQRPAVESEEFL